MPQPCPHHGSLVQKATAQAVPPHHGSLVQRELSAAWQTEGLSARFPIYYISSRLPLRYYRQYKIFDGAPSPVVDKEVRFSLCAAICHAIGLFSHPSRESVRPYGAKIRPRKFRKRIFLLRGRRRARLTYFSYTVPSRLRTASRPFPRAAPSCGTKSPPLRR